MSQADRTERLLNLLFALMASARPVPKAFLRDAIDAYHESPSDEAFERMFERDKEELRCMGVPILTVEGSDGSGRHRGLPRRRRRLRAPGDRASPPTSSPSGSCRARVGAGQPRPGRPARAAQARGRRRHDRRGLWASRRGSSTTEPSFPVLLDGLPAAPPRRGSTTARPEDSTAATRTVQPWGVTSRRGHWYLVGHDVDRGAPRVFRLSRVVGDVTPTGQPGAYEVPDGVDVAGLDRRVHAGARLARRARSAWPPTVRTACAAAPPPSSRAWAPTCSLVPYSDDEVLARELVGLGADVAGGRARRRCATPSSDGCGIAAGEVPA